MVLKHYVFFKKNLSVFAALCFLLISSEGFGQTTADYNTPGSQTFTVPCGVNSITVQCWGGGGAGGGGSRGGGGGGGAFALKIISVTPGTVYNLYVGSGGTVSTGNGGAGSATSFNSTEVVAASGAGGNSGGSGAGGAGGAAAACTGTTIYQGGNGAAGSGGNSGGGGGGGNNLGAGNNASGMTGGTGGSSTGVAGGNGATGFSSDSYGANGNYYSGGGSGSRGSYYGGYGASGRVVITYTATPPAASITTSPASVCNGASTSIGGNVTAMGSWTLTLSDGSTVTGSGSGTWNATVSPSSTATYTITSLVNGSCNALAGNLTGSITVTVAGFPTNVSGATTSSCTLHSENHWIYFTSGGLALTAVTDYTAGGDMGATNVQVYTPASVLSYNGVKYMQRMTAITPASNAPSRVRLYFTETDFQNLKNSDPAYASKTYSDLRVTKFPGNVSVPSGTPQLMSSVSVTNNIHGWSNRHALEFDNTSYSTFFIHFGNNTSPLPVELINFSANCNNKYEADLSWSTASELNSQKFLLEKSRDMVNWVFINDQPAAGNSNYVIDYTAKDPEPAEGISYYRLIQIDNNGMEKVYGPISVSCEDEQNSMYVFPNPSEGKFTVEISSVELIIDAQLQITDLTGKLVAIRSLNILEGKSQALFEGLELQSGTYFVSLESGKKLFTPVKVVIGN